MCPTPPAHPILWADPGALQLLITEQETPALPQSQVLNPHAISWTVGPIHVLPRVPCSPFHFLFHTLTWPVFTPAVSAFPPCLRVPACLWLGVGMCGVRWSWVPPSRSIQGALGGWWWQNAPDYGTTEWGRGC